MPLTPKNRKEEWLQGLVDHETTLTPKNRDEEWMKEIIDASGGGGGIDLGITGASAGEYAKIKTVDADGAPTAWESGGGVMIANNVNGTLDKTWKELYDASISGTPCYISSHNDDLLLDFLQPILAFASHSPINYRIDTQNDEYGCSSENDYPSIVE